jgi:hypothetical protein
MCCKHASANNQVTALAWGNLTMTVGHQHATT